MIHLYYFNQTKLWKQTLSLEIMFGFDLDYNWKDDYLLSYFFGMVATTTRERERER